MQGQVFSSTDIRRLKTSPYNLSNVATFGVRQYLFGVEQLVEEGALLAVAFQEARRQVLVGLVVALQRHQSDEAGERLRRRQPHGRVAVAHPAQHLLPRRRRKKTAGMSTWSAKQVSWMSEQHRNDEQDDVGDDTQAEPFDDADERLHGALALVHGLGDVEQRQDGVDEADEDALGVDAAQRGQTARRHVAHGPVLVRQQPRQRRHQLQQPVVQRRTRRRTHHLNDSTFFSAPTSTLHPASNSISSHALSLHETEFSYLYFRLILSLIFGNT